MNEKAKITIEVHVNTIIDIAWASFISEESIIHWNHASEDWRCPWAKNDLRVGGEFSYRMEAKDGSFGFDFGGKYLEIEDKKKIAYELGDGRRVEVYFAKDEGKTKITETFEAENQNTLERQKNGWQAILNNYKFYTENGFKS